MKNVYLAWGTVGAVLLVSAMFVIAPRVVHSAKSEALSCVPTLIAQCPSQDFLRGYDHWKTMRDAIGAADGKESVVVTEQRSDEFNGLTNRLSGMVPKGYQWDEKQRRFIPIPAQAQPAPPSAPVTPTAPPGK